MIRHVLRFAARVFGRLAAVLGRLGTRPDGPPYAAWLAADGDRTYRLDYPLDSEAMVMAVGGYKGDWSSDIFGSYACTIHIYEPVGQFVAFLRQRFAKNPRIVVHPVGLSDATREAHITVDGDRSSVLPGVAVGETVSLVDVKEAVDALERDIDLMMVNIEGAEYDVIERLCSTGAIGRINYLQVQFHDFAPNAAQRRQQTRSSLQATHDLVWDFPFVWESWRRRAPS